MSSRSYIKANLSLAWPLALNALLMQSMLMIDTLLVTPLGEISLAALGIATTILAFMLGIQMALANGTQLVLSRAMGAGNQYLQVKSFWAGMVINVGAALVGWVLLTLGESKIVPLLTQDAELLAEIHQYLVIAKYILIANGITQVVIALFNASGKTQIPFKGYLIEMPLNAGLSYLFIYEVAKGEGLGVQGAALGSLIAILFRFAYLGLCLFEAKKGVVTFSSIRKGFYRNVAQHFREIFPVAANVTILQVGATIYMLLYSQLDINAYVAITLVMPWIRAGTQFITAWAHSSAITISQAIGSGDIGSLRKNVDTSIDMAVFISFLSALFFWGLSFVLPDLYPELAVSTYHALAVIAPLYILLPVIRGYNTVHGHILRALGKTTSVFKINFTGQWLIAIPLCALVVIVLDASVVWAFAILPLEEAIKALPFRMLARKSLNEFDINKAKRLMYD